MRRFGATPEEEEELIGEIRSQLLSEIEGQAEHKAAGVWSTTDDQTLIDLEKKGYDPASAINIATFGSYSTAVNGDVLIARFWEKTLRISKKAHPQLWTDVGTSELLKWMRKNGYEEVAHLGGRVHATEEEIQLDHVVDRVADELEVAEDIVWRIMKQLCDRDVYCDRRGELVYMSVRGGTELWAKLTGKYRSGGSWSGLHRRR